MGSQAVGPLCPSLLSTMGGAGIGALNKRTLRGGAMRFGTLTFISLTPPLPPPLHSFSGFSLHRPGRHRSPTPSLRRGAAGASPGTHPTKQPFLDPPGFGFSPSLYSGLGLGGTATLLPGKNCTGQIARTLPLGTPVPRQEAAPS